MGYVNNSLKHLSETHSRLTKLEKKISESNVGKLEKIYEEPIEDNDICNKKYVDEEIDSLYKNLDDFVTKKHLDDELKKDQGDESSKIDLSEYAKIKYVDDENKNYLQSKGGKMLSNLDMSNFKISNVLMGLDTNDVATNKTLEYFARSYFSETMLWEYYVTKANCFYKIDRGSSSELTTKGRNVSKLFDQTLNRADCSQNTHLNQPTLANGRVNKRRFLNFNGDQLMKSSINLNPQGEKDIVSVFIVYKINDLSGSSDVRCGIFGHDNGGYDKFLCFGAQGQLMISGTENDFTIVGPNSLRSKNPIAPYKNLANPGEIGKWICLSIHWDCDSSPLTNKSSVWCNGQKLTNFTGRQSAGSNTMTFGDLNPNGVAGLKGSIALFSLYKSFKMKDEDIRLHHRVFCNNWYGINTENIPIM